MRLLKIGSRVDWRDRSVVRLSGQLVIDRNKKIISDIGRIALELGKGLEDKRGYDRDEKSSLCHGSIQW